MIVLNHSQGGDHAADVTEKCSEMFPTGQELEGFVLVIKLKNNSIDLGGKEKAQRSTEKVFLSETLQ